LVVAEGVLRPVLIHARNAFCKLQYKRIGAAGCRPAGNDMAANPVFVDQTLRMAGSKPGLLTLTIKDKSALYLAYMPFVKNGGLFVPTNSPFRLGDDVFLLLSLIGEDDKLPIAGRVIWVTPKGASGRRAAGIGVQFSEQDHGQTQNKIETLLAGALAGDKYTYTM
jgi:type IV pilus assembly protein PilZ